jgi:Holliday junction resolvase RusA-like endonuclease
MAENKDQQHPLWNNDRQVVDSLLNGEPTDYNLAELARLRMRYNGFPGARDIKSDLDNILKKWQLTEETLFEKTRQIHEVGQVYKGRGTKRDDWS